jgi:hypothetical protein
MAGLLQRSLATRDAARCPRPAQSDTAAEGAVAAGFHSQRPLAGGTRIALETRGPSGDDQAFASRSDRPPWSRFPCGCGALKGWEDNHPGRRATSPGHRNHDLIAGAALLLSNRTGHPGRVGPLASRGLWIPPGALQGTERSEVDAVGLSRDASVLLATEPAPEGSGTHGLIESLDRRTLPRSRRTRRRSVGVRMPNLTPSSSTPTRAVWRCTLSRPASPSRSSPDPCRAGSWGDPGRD